MGDREALCTDTCVFTPSGPFYLSWLHEPCDNSSVSDQISDLGDPGNAASSADTDYVFRRDYGPGIILGNNWWGSGTGGRFLAALVAFVINYACYFSEIYRGGIQSIPVGQYEAGQVLGMTKGQIFRKVVLLQVIKRIVPPMSNEIITLVKDTSLARVIAVYEIIWNGQSFIKSAGIIWPLFYTGVFYLLFSGLLTILFDRVEKKLSYFR